MPLDLPILNRLAPESIGAPKQIVVQPRPSHPYASPICTCKGMSVLYAPTFFRPDNLGSGSPMANVTPNVGNKIAPVHGITGKDGRTRFRATQLGFG
jgi:hypothetical protein